MNTGFITGSNGLAQNVIKVIEVLSRLFDDLAYNEDEVKRCTYKKSLI